MREKRERISLTGSPNLVAFREQLHQASLKYAPDVSQVKEDLKVVNYDMSSHLVDSRPISCVRLIDSEKSVCGSWSGKVLWIRKGQIESSLEVCKNGRVTSLGLVAAACDQVIVGDSQGVVSLLCGASDSAEVLEECQILNAPVTSVACTGQAAVVTGGIEYSLLDLNRSLKPLYSSSVGIGELKCSSFHGCSAIVAVGGEQGVSVIDLRIGKSLFNVHSDFQVTCLSLTGNQIFYGTTGNTVGVFNLRKRQPMTQILAHSKTVSGVQAVNEGQHVFSCGLDGYVKVFDVSYGKPIWETQLGENKLLDMAVFRENSNRFQIGISSWDKSIRFIRLNII
jgi:WD40 repeat protein